MTLPTEGQDTPLGNDSETIETRQDTSHNVPISHNREIQKMFNHQYMYVQTAAGITV